MIPDSAVWSPVAVIRIRRLPPAGTGPATTVSPASLATGRDSPVDHRLVDDGVSPSTDTLPVNARLARQASSMSSSA